MSRIKRARPALVVVVVALIAALAGTALAGSGPDANTAGAAQKAKKALKKSKKALKKANANATLLDELCGAGASAAGSETCTAPQGPKGDTGDTGATGPSTGPAGGDLTGNYPDPSIANGAVGTQEHSGAIPAAGVTNTTAQTIGSSLSTFTTLAFNAERYDTANLHSTVTNNSRLTAPVTGIYEIGASIEWASNATGTRDVRLIRNFTTGFAFQGRESHGFFAQTINRVVRLEAGAVVQVQVTQDSGADLDIRKSGELTPEFTMTWLAPG